MEHPPFWLMLLGSSVFGLLTRAKAAKYRKNTTLWFWLGFIFGIWGFIAFYLTKKTMKIAPTLPPLKPVLNITGNAWYYSQNQKAEGPCSAEFIKKLYENGQLSDETLVWNETLESWTDLGRFK